MWEHKYFTIDGKVYNSKDSIQGYTTKDRYTPHTKESTKKIPIKKLAPNQNAQKGKLMGKIFSSQKLVCLEVWRGRRVDGKGGKEREWE